MFLVVTDAYSKWLDVRIAKQANSKTTISILRSIFATHGIPELIVSDNGTPFTSYEFQAFAQSNGIRHNTSAPYHPATNGLAERAVQTFKRYLRKATEGSLQDRLAQFLFRYCITPHSTTGSSPAQLLLGRQPRSRLDLLRPDLHSKVQQQQERKKVNKDNQSQTRYFAVNDSVLVTDLPAQDTRLPGTITKVLGSLSYEIRLSDNRTVRRHVDHIRMNSIPGSTELHFEANSGIPIDWVPRPIVDPEQSLSPSSEHPQVAPPPPLRRSGRISHPPERLADQYT
jgi:hypothetical protein